MKYKLFLFAFLFFHLRPPTTYAIHLPHETVSYKHLPGVDLANGYCLTCHSADYVATQPPALGRTFWLKEVQKMKQAFGAPIPDDQIPGIADYLVRAYGDPKTP